ncbi:DUF4974 domain-containing protein [Prolixibacteraceae bacterium JC049]|nr:DUF4974 domain-containing protein [Prolixibacteraceae bacterium JC049]
MEQQNVPWNIISAYLNGTESNEQKEELKQWLSLSPDNGVVLDEIISAWQISHNSDDTYKPNEEQLWQQLMQRIEKKPRLIPWQPVVKWLSVAAAVVLIFLAGNWLGKDAVEEVITYSTVVAPPGSKTQLLLPDSTKVWLNSGAELKYANTYAANNREVFIKGECYFDVVKSTQHHFVVNTSRLKVKVFGTKFNVNENSKRNSTAVTLVSGKVQVLNQRDKELSKLNPNDQLELTGNKFQVRKLTETSMTTAWTRNLLVFNNQSLGEVVDYLESWFGVKIILDPRLADREGYTFKTKTENLKEVLKMISIITPISYEIDGDIIRIKPKN